MERKHIFLTKIQISELNKSAKRKQIKLSELLRRIIDSFLEKESIENKHDISKMDKK